MTFVLRLFIVLALALSAPALSVAQNLQTIAAQAELSTARVITRSGTGSGFVVGKGTNGSFFLVTNHHVIEGETEAVVAFGLKDRIVAYGAKVKNASSELDMAVLHVFPKGEENHNIVRVPLATREIIKGEEIFALGFPGATDFWVGDKTSPDAFETTLTRGVVSKVTTGSWGGKGMQLELVQHTASINPGNSGGPLFNYCGQVMGVNTAGLKGVNDSYVSSSSNALAGFLRSSDVPFATVSSACDPNKPNAGSAKEEAPSNATETSDAGASNSNMLLIALGVVLALGTVGGAIAFGVMKGGGSGGGGGGKSSPRPSGFSSGGGMGPAVLTLDVAGQSGSVGLSKDALAAGAILGRDDQADVTISGSKVSREHARLSLVDRKLTLTDLGSTNGTTIDGKPLGAHKPTQINSQSVIELGGVRLSLRKA